MFLILFIFLLSGFYSYAQKKFTINGIVRDAASGETLIGASIRVQNPGISGVMNIPFIRKALNHIS
jgi:hypothetical protein